MNAFLLAGGVGTRLKPYTTVIPKPLMPVGNRAIIEILLLQLRKAGIAKVYISVGYLSHLIKAYLGDGQRFGLEFEFVHEEYPLGTAGAVGLVLDHLGEDFLLLNGDLLTTIDFKELIAFHKAQNAAATIGTYERSIQIDYGVLDIGPTGELANYTEKPRLAYNVSMGVYVINQREVAKLLTPVRRIDAPELMKQLLEAKSRVVCYKADCYWLDIGRPEDYQMANESIQNATLNLGV